MIDGNELILNQATMCRAVQHWLNNEVLQNNATVSSVSYNASSYQFEITLSEVPA